MEQAGVALIAQGSAAYLGDMKSATNATNTFVDATEKGGGRVSAAGQVMIGSLRQVGVIAVQAFGQALRAGADFVGDSIDLAGDFEQGMSVLQETSGATAEEMEQLAAKAKELGSDLTLPATSAVDAGKAMLELAKAGFTAEQQMDATKGVLQLAAAAQIDEAKAAEINANALQAFNLEAKESIFVSDLLAASANASSIDATDMADTYKMAGAIFSAFQGPVVGSKEALIDLTTAAALLGNAGIKGSDAGTSLKQSLLQLAAPSDKAKGLMQGLAADIGITGDIAFDAQGKMRSFPEILRLTAESTKGLSDEARDYNIATIFGADAARAILILMQQGPEAWDKMTAAVTRQGAAQDLAAAQTKGWNGALEGAKSQVETLQLIIGQALTPMLADLFNNYVSPGVATLTTLTEALLGNDDAFNHLSPTMQGVARGIEQFFDDVARGIQIVQSIATEIDALIGTFSAAEAESDTLGSAITDLSGVWDKALVVVGNVANGYMHIAQAVLPIITRLWDEHGTEISAFVKTTYDSVIEIVNLGLDIYNSIVPPVLNAIAGFISDHGSEITKILSGVWEVISSLITGTLETIKGVFKVALAVINGDWEGAWTGIGDIASAQATAIGGIVTGFLNVIAGLFDTSLTDIAQTWADNWNMLVDIVTNIDWAAAGMSIIEGIIEGIESGAGRLFDALMDLGRSAFDAFMEGIIGSSPAQLFVPAGQSIVQGIMQGISDNWGGLTALIGSLSKDLIDEMQDIGSQIQGVIADSFGATASIDRQIAKNLDKFKDILPQYQQYTQGALKQAQQEAQAFADPAEGARFFKMRSDQILEYAKLQQDLADAETASDRERIEAQMLLINAAQSAELAQFNATPRNDPKGDIASQINAIMAALADTKKFDLTDEQLHWVDMLSAALDMLGGVPHLARGGVAHAGQPHWVGEDGPELFWPGVTGMVSPAASSQQMAARAQGGATYNGQVGNTFNMPIYTNQSSQAIQQSWAVMQASMP